MKRDVNARALKAGIWYTIGNIFLKGCIFLTLPIFTRIMSTSDFGIYNTYIAYEGLLTAIIGLGFYGSIKNAKLDFDKDFDKYVSAIITICIMVVFILLLLANLLYNYYSEVFGFSRLITNCLILQSFGSCLLSIYSAKFSIEFKYKSYILMVAFNTITNIVVSILLIKFVFTNEAYLGRILGSAFPLIILALILTVYIISKGRTFYSKNYWRYGLKIGLPLIPHVISQSLLSQFDRIMINNMENAAAAGIYSYIYTLCTITYVICCSLDTSWTAWIYMKIKDHNVEEIRNISIKYVALFSMIILGFICVMPEMTKVIAGEEDWLGTDLIVPLSLANYYIFMYMIPVGIEYFNKKTNYISFGTVSAAVLNIVLNYFAIKIFGFKAAAYTTFASYLALYYFHRFMANKYELKSYYDLRKITKINILTIFISMVILITSKYSVINILIRYSIVLCIFIVLYTQRKYVINFFKKADNYEENA